MKAAEKRWRDADEKLSLVNVVVRPDALNEEGLPLTEIREDLDDDNNVMCMLIDSSTCILLT